jgi:hypothetical protein
MPLSPGIENEELSLRALCASVVKEWNDGRKENIWG